MNLIQLVLVIVIVGVLAGAFALPIVSGIDLWEQMQTRRELLVEAHYALERMAREMSCVQDDKAVSVMLPQTFTFTSSATNEAVTFFYASVNSAVLRNSTPLLGGDSPVKMAVSEFSFTYYDMWNNTVMAPSLGNPYTPVWRIEINLKVSAFPGGQPVNLREQVYPRALQRETKGGAYT